MQLLGYTRALAGGLKFAGRSLTRTKGLAITVAARVDVMQALRSD